MRRPHLVATEESQSAVSIAPAFQATRLESSGWNIPPVLLLSEEKADAQGCQHPSLEKLLFPEEVEITANTTEWSSEQVRPKLDPTALIELEVLFTENDLA